MILGIGVDVVSVDRVRRAAERGGDRFLTRLFTPSELAFRAESRRVWEHRAARFAAKEAAMKALGRGWGSGVAWKEIEIERRTGHGPRIVFHGRAAERAREMGVGRAWVSFAHDETTAVAQVVLEGGEPR